MVIIGALRILSIWRLITSTRSKVKHYNPHNIDEHSPDFDVNERDELGACSCNWCKGVQTFTLEWITTHVWQRHGPLHSGRSYSDRFKIVKALRSR